MGQNPCRPSRALGDPAPKHTDATHPGIPAYAQQPGRSHAIWLPGDLAQSGCREISRDLAARTRLVPRPPRASRLGLPPTLPATEAAGATRHPRGVTTASALLEPALAVTQSRSLRGLPASPSRPRGLRLARPCPHRCRFSAG